MFKREYLRYVVLFFVAFFSSSYLAWMLCNYRLLLAVFVFGMYFMGGVGFFSFKTWNQKAINVGVFLGILTGSTLYMQRYIS